MATVNILSHYPSYFCNPEFAGCLIFRGFRHGLDNGIKLKSAQFHFSKFKFAPNYLKRFISAKVFQILIYILVFIASCRRGKFAPSTPRGTSAISHGDKPNLKFNLVKTHRARLEVSGFTSLPRELCSIKNHPSSPSSHRPSLSPDQRENNQTNNKSITAKQLVLSAGESNAGLSRSARIL